MKMNSVIDLQMSINRVTKKRIDVLDERMDCIESTLRELLAELKEANKALAKLQATE